MSCQPISYCLLEQIPSYIFELICTFLDLPTKCWRFPILNRTFRILFRIDRCCRDKITFEMNKSNDKPQEYYHSLAQYISYASNVRYQYRDDRSLQYSIFRSIAFRSFNSCLNNPNLQVLRIQVDEPVLFSYFKPNIINGSLKNLIRLELLALNDERLSSSDIDFKFLSSCVQLKSFSCNLDAVLPKWIDDICQSIPPSLTELTLGTVTSFRIIQEYLQDPTFLPRLTHIYAMDQMLYNMVWHDDDKYKQNSEHNYLWPGLTTMIPEFGTSRPIQHLNLHLGNDATWLSLDWCNQLRSLFLTIAFENNHYETLVSLPDDVLLSLEIVQIGLYQVEYLHRTNTTHDLSSLVLFLSKRPIHIWCFFLSENLHIAQFDEETLKKFCTMKKLSEILWLCAQPLTDFNFKPINFDFPKECFPNLSKVELSLGPFNMYSLSSFFHACPSLNHVNLCSHDIEVVDSLRKIFPLKIA